MWRGGCSAAAGLLVLVAACATPDTDVDPPLEVAVSIGPLGELVERVGGDLVRVSLLTPPATPPETWAPTPREALALARSDLYLSVGHPHLGAERSHLTRLADGVETLDRLVMTAPGTEAEEEPGEEHQEAHASGHGHGDPHLWMDLDLLASTASAVAGWLAERRPDDAEAVEGRLADYLADLNRTDRELAALFEADQRRPAYFQHAAWGRLLRRYGVQSEAIEEEGKEASPARLTALVEEARGLGVTTVFSQVGVSDRGARLLATELGGEVVALDPTSVRWLETLEATGERVAAAIH